MQSKSRTRTIIITALWLVLGLMLVISLSVGRFVITPANFKSAAAQNIFWNVRLPRVVMAAFCGGALAVSGSIFQQLFRNVLASPEIVGVSSGAGLGAAFALVCFGANALLVPAFAFVGGLAAVILALLLSGLNKRRGLFGLVVAGVVIGSLCNSGIMLLKTVADPYRTLPSIEFWLMGGLYTLRTEQVVVMLAVGAVVMVGLSMLRFRLSLMSLSDDEISALGTKPFTLRLIFISAATLLVATVVAFCGIIGWIGLLAPYIARMLTGRLNIKLSFVIGAIILLTADTLARTLTAAEIPVGIMVSLISAPFLLLLLWREQNA